MKRTLTILATALGSLAIIIITACGGSTTQTHNGQPIDPSGNWSMKFSDTAGSSFLLSALFSQTGSVVTALNLLAAGNPPPFNCVPFAATFANGQVQNVDQFSGDINTSFGNIHFTSTLNTQGSHAAGTYTLTGSCWGVATTGTFSADEIPSVSGSWTGTLNCTSNCPAGATTGTITATLTQDDATGIVAGTYVVTGLSNISSGTLTTKSADVLSGASWQDSMTDANGNTYVIAGGPFNGALGLGLDRSFHGSIFERQDAHSLALATYTVVMSH